MKTIGVIAAACPVAPPGAQQYADQLTGYVLWGGVIILFFVGVAVGIGAMVAGGRVFSMPHASKAGVVSIVMVFVSAAAYMVVPSMLAAMTGSGCVQ